MKTAHLILAHSAPAQLARLIRQLQRPDAAFFIHIDRKTDIAPFLFLASVDRVHFIGKREKVRWGAYSIVQATVNGFREILDSDYSFTHINLLSGQDYPLQDAGKMQQYFDARTESSFMLFRSVMNDWQEAIPRLREYHLTHFSFPGRYRVQRLVNALLPPRPMPGQLVPVGRSQWMTLALDAVKYILDYLDTHPEVVRFFEWTWAPDEMLFQTILYNSPFRESLVNDDLRYIDWSEGLPSPRTLTTDDATALLASGKLFARKFDMAHHPEILDLLDEHIASNR